MDPKKENQSEKKKKVRDKLIEFVKYSNIGFALAGAGLIGYLAGSFLDSYFSTEKPIWTASLIAFFVLIYVLKVVIELVRS